MEKILIVEDEEKLRDELKQFLQNNGYNVVVLEDFNDTISYIKKIDVDLILLDINIPNINGEIVCKEVRKEKSTPIIMVTSRNTEIDELLSINYGADDFITKPYNTQILLARIDRLLKRSCNISDKVAYKDLILDMSSSSIKKRDIVVPLSRNELKIFYFLLLNKGKIVSRESLINYLWDNDEFVDDNTLTVNINRLRNKLFSIEEEEVIITKRGQGYIVL
ncbi:MAG: response regulator transcription factor [Clostridia bacterium]|nr:response regulator transcription factor [Clostridia bacterium]